MNLSDTFYVALCMTILILGVVYWFWTQNQFVLRKLNLLNNIVFEMRAQRNKEEVPEGFVAPPVYAPAPGSELGEDEDLTHEELHSEVDALRAAAQEATEETQHVELPEETVQGTSIEGLAEPIDSELQPGGVGSGATAPETSGVPNVLESMTIKELRRLAEQRGISGTSSMKKPQLITALREKPVATPFEVAESASPRRGATVALN